jgi:hypothetical protein
LRSMLQLDWNGGFKRRASTARATGTGEPGSGRGTRFHGRDVEQMSHVASPLSRSRGLRGLLAFGVAAQPCSANHRGRRTIADASISPRPKRSVK